jgi:hypothetical protein
MFKVLQNKLAFVPSQYKTEQEVAQLLFRSLHNPDATCQLCAMPIQNKGPYQEGELLQSSLATMTAKDRSSPEVRNKRSTIPIVRAAIEGYLMTTSETKAPDKRVGVIKQAAHPVLL